MIYFDKNNNRRVKLALPRKDKQYATFVIGEIDFDSGYLECKDSILDYGYAVDPANWSKYKPFKGYYEITDTIKHEIFITIFGVVWNE